MPSFVAARVTANPDISIRDQAEKCADLEGTSLNLFITLAIAEKLAHMNSQATQHTQVADADKEAPKVIRQEPK